MKKIACLLFLASGISACAQKSAVKKPVPPVKTVSTNSTPRPMPASVSGDKNIFAFTIEEQGGTKHEILISSAPKSVDEKSSYFNTARVDLAHTDGNGNKQPVFKLDINNEKNQNLSASIMSPVVNDTGTILVTYQSDYDNLNNWFAHFENYRLSPQNITVTITKWPAVGEFVEGTFRGTASMIKDNVMYDNDNPAPVVSINNGKFRIKRVKDQTTYGGE